jgi:Amino acid synthesis
MTVRKTVTLVEEINSEYGAPASPPLRRVAIAAVFENPLAGKAASADLKPLIEYSLELGASLTKTALATLGASPAQLRAYTKAAVVGIGGDLEHGAAMIHPTLGMAMRRAIKRGRVIIPGHAKVGPPGTTVDLIYGPLDEGWDLDAFDSTPGADPRRAAAVRDRTVDRLRHRSARQRPLQGSGSEGSRRTRRILRQQLVKRL